MNLPYIRPAKKGDILYSVKWVSKRGCFICVFCPQHGRLELVQQRRFHEELGDWYFQKIHPRFSPFDAFRSAGQRPDEISRLSGNGFEDRNREGAHEVYLKALKASRTPEEFLEFFHPRLFTDLKSGERDYRVPNAFKKKFDSRSFVPEDFFAEANHEFRRLIIRAGVTIKDVLGRMTRVAGDDEGELYDLRESGSLPGRVAMVFPTSGDPNMTRYLHVSCPSTGAEYLLEVPNGIQSPKEARRWTFDLDADAEFIKEA